MELRVLFILSCLAIVQCKLVPLSCKQIRAFVDGHNSRRLLVAQGKIRGQPAASQMKKMVWDEELQSKASKWANVNGDLMDHNRDKTIGSGRFLTGENLHWELKYSSNNHRHELNIDSLLESWFSEHVNFTFGPLQDKNIQPNSPKIRHYTQMVWSETIYLGCGVSETFKDGWTTYLVVCNYGPVGNIINQTPYQANRRPTDKLICAAENCDNPYGKQCENLNL